MTDFLLVAGDPREEDEPGIRCDECGIEIDNEQLPALFVDNDGERCMTWCRECSATSIEIWQAWKQAP